MQPKTISAVLTSGVALLLAAYFAQSQPTNIPAITSTTIPTDTNFALVGLATNFFAQNSNLLNQSVSGSSITGAVATVFGREGIVVAVSNDYSADKIGVAFTATNHTPTANDVLAHLMSLDDALADVGAGFSNSAGLRSLLSDETGTGAAVFAGGNIGAATATTPSADDNDTSVATTAYVQTELGALSGDWITSGTVADARIASTIARDSEVAAAYQPLDSDLTTLAALNGGSLTNINGGSIQAGTVNSNALDAATLALLGGGGGSGDVVGPASSIAYEIAIYDDTTGKLLGNSGVTASNGVLTVGTLSVDALAVTEYDFGGITNLVGSGLTNNNGVLESISGGSGTVTSVALSAPAEFSVSGSPVTTSGTLTLSKANQDANLIYAGPSSGAAAAPTFRALATNDMPAGVTLDDEAAAAYQPLDSDLTTLATLNGAALTNLNGSSIASGTVADARIDAAIARDAEVAAAYEPLNANKYQATNTFLTTLAGVGAATGSGNVMRTRTGVYRDLFISAGAMVPSTTNGAATGTMAALPSDAGDTTKDVFDFDDTTSESVQFSLTLPDTWDLGTLKIKLGYSQKSAVTGTNVLSVAAKAVSSGDSFVGAFGTAVTTTNVVADSTNKMTIVTSGALTVGGTPAAGDELVFKVSRLPSDAYDTASGDLRLHWLRLQYAESTTEPSAW